MRSIPRLPVVLLVISSCTSGAPRPAGMSPPTERSSIRTYSLRSEVFGNERLLRVYLPAGHETAEALDVLYLNDGQNALGADDLDRDEDWRVDEIADSLIRAGEIPPVVIVGIDNIGVTYRGREYLPWPDRHLSPPIPDPDGKQYPDFVVHEVMPFIEARLRVKHRGPGVGIGGFSYGGLSAVFVAMQYPERFGALLAETPSLYVDDQRILREAEASAAKWPTKAYLGVGTNERGLEGCPQDDEGNAMAVADVRKLREVIERNSSRTRTKLEVTECGTHSFSAISVRLGDALRFLYGPGPLDSTSR